MKKKILESLVLLALSTTAFGLGFNRSDELRTLHKDMSALSERLPVLIDKAVHPVEEEKLEEKLEETVIPFRKQIEYKNQEIPLRTLIDQYLAEGGSLKDQRKLVIDKSERKMGVYLGDQLLKEYEVSTGIGKGDRQRRGDAATPIGTFYIAQKNPYSHYHKALVLSYPDIAHAEKGVKAGLISRKEYNSILNSINQCTLPNQHTKLGSLIEIHGGGKGRVNWTAGCTGLDDNSMDEVYSFAQTGCHKKTPRTMVIIQE